MNARIIFICIILFGFIFHTTFSLATPVNGAESIILEGGKRGNILFPHGIHQGVTVDCLPCHSIFSKEPKIIVKMKSDGKLKKKVVMNMCKGCHRELAGKGEKAGPTSCRGCHKK
jgi:hypothetical protein